MNFIVYKITNKLNGKLYFGITKYSIKKRMNEHRHNSLRANKKSHLALAMKKYGDSNFSIELVKKCASEAEMYQTEINLIREFNTNNRLFGYNNSTGGEISSIGAKHSEETKRRIGDIQRGQKRKPYTPEFKEKLSKIAKENGRSPNRSAVELSANNHRGKNAGNAISVLQYSLDGVLLNVFKSQREAAKSVGGVNAFSFIKSGRLKTYKGFIWKFAS